VRTLFLRQKAGHVGSLDPLATGMLPICLGEATKIAGQILAGRKRYRFTVALGVATATGDAEGAVTTRSPVPPFDRLALEALLTRFRGPQTQTPPMYSLESLAETRARGEWPRLLSSDWPLGHLTAVRLSASEARRLLSGQSVRAEVAGATAAVRLYDEAGTFLGLGEADRRGAVRPRRLFSLSALSLSARVP